MVPICAGWAKCQHGLLQGYFSSIVWGLETPPEGTLQPRHYYLARVWDNHTVPLSFLVKVPLQLISEPNLFMLFCTGSMKRDFFKAACEQVGFPCWKRTKRDYVTRSKLEGKEDEAGWVTSDYVQIMQRCHVWQKMLHRQEWKFAGWTLRFIFSSNWESVQHVSHIAPHPSKLGLFICIRKFQLGVVLPNSSTPPILL